MKVMSVGQFISERIKIKPVTNAEFDKIKQNIESNTISKTKPITKDSLLLGLKMKLKRDKNLENTFCDRDSDGNTIMKNPQDEISYYLTGKHTGWKAVFKNFAYYLKYVYFECGNREIFVKSGGINAYAGYASDNEWTKAKGYVYDNPRWKTNKNISMHNSDSYREFVKKYVDPIENDYIKNVYQKYPISIEFVNTKNFRENISVTDKNTISTIIGMITEISYKDHWSKWGWLETAIDLDKLNF